MNSLGLVTTVILHLFFLYVIIIQVFKSPEKRPSSQKYYSKPRKLGKKPRLLSKSEDTMKKMIGVTLCAACLLSMAASPPAKAKTAPESYTAQVYASSLNVRKEPAKNADVVGSIKNGAQVTVKDEQHGWLKIPLQLIRYALEAVREHNTRC